jgi:hypothetical protein
MGKGAREMNDKTADESVAIDMRVRVYPGTDAECRGVIVDDFGQAAGHLADPARRWAVRLDTGSLVFTNSDQLVPE